MQVDILTPEKKIFSGKVKAVQLPGVDGSFEILNRHAPLVSALKKGTLIIYKDTNQKKEYIIETGFIEVLNNIATILIEGISEKTAGE